jgi:hypothetical protein
MFMSAAAIRGGISPVSEIFPEVKKRTGKSTRKSLVSAASMAVSDFWRNGFKEWVRSPVFKGLSEYKGVRFAMAGYSTTSRGLFDGGSPMAHFASVVGTRL